MFKAGQSLSRVEKRRFAPLLSKNLLEGESLFIYRNTHLLRKNFKDEAFRSLVRQILASNVAQVKDSCSTQDFLQLLDHTLHRVDNPTIILEILALVFRKGLTYDAVLRRNVLNTAFKLIQEDESNRRFMGIANTFLSYVEMDCPQKMEHYFLGLEDKIGECSNTLQSIQQVSLLQKVARHSPAGTNKTQMLELHLENVIKTAEFFDWQQLGELLECYFYLQPQAKEEKVGDQLRFAIETVLHRLEKRPSLYSYNPLAVGHCLHYLELLSDEPKSLLWLNRANNVINLSAGYRRDLSKLGIMNILQYEWKKAPISTKSSTIMEEIESLLEMRLSDIGINYYLGARKSLELYLWLSKILTRPILVPSAHLENLIFANQVCPVHKLTVDSILVSFDSELFTTLLQSYMKSFKKSHLNLASIIDRCITAANNN